MSNLIMCVLTCSFSEVTKRIKTNGETVIVSKKDKKQLRKLRQLLNLLHDAGHLI
jgi:hypothetical protein